MFKMLIGLVLQAAAVLQSLAASAWRMVLRLLNSHTYRARTSLIAAMATATPNCSEVFGLAAMEAESVIPYLACLVGDPGEGGLLGCLSSAEWALRRAAIEAIRAVLIARGPDLSVSLAAATASAVSAVKHDNAKPVRVVAAETHALLAALTVGLLLTRHA